MSDEKLLSEVTHKRYLPTTPDSEVERVLSSTEIKNPSLYKRGERTKKDELPEENIVKALSKMQQAKHQDYRSIIELLPELQRGMQILESAVLSPKDLMNPTLMFRMKEDIVSDAVSDVLSAIQLYLTNNYDLSERLPTLLREALHSKGAYVLGVIPRNSIDALVQEGTERVNMQSAGTLAGDHSLVKPLGMLGIPVKQGESVNMQSLHDILPSSIGEEQFAVSGMSAITITDNFNCLKLPRIAAKERRRAVTSAIRPKVGMRTKDGVTMLSASDSNIEQLFKRRDYDRADKIILETPSGSEEVYGRPLEQTWPMAATIPVHVGGDVTNKVGVILLTDETGSPITEDSVESQYSVLQSNLRKADDNSMSATLQRVQDAMGGRPATNLRSREALVNLQTSFNNMVTTDLVERIQSGVYGPEAGIAQSDIALELAFKRLLCDRKTRMVFIPEEISTYIAFDYDEYGIGRSRLESSKIIASMRAILLYTNMNAAMTNAIPNMKLNIKLDEDDTDPEGTIDDTIAEFYALNSMRLKPGSTLNSHDITEMLQQMGVTISVTGNKRYPDMDVSLEDVGRSKATIERDLDESLAKRIWLMMGLSPEAVDSSFDVEFARTIVSNNLFLAKLASEIQFKLLYQYSAHARKLIYSDGNLMTELLTIVSDRLKGKSEEEVIDHLNELIEGFQLALPSTDIAKIESQQQALENYTNFVEGAIEAFVNEEMFDGIVEGELDETVRPAIRAYRDMLIRDFMKRENILPELQAISNGEDDEIDLGARFGEHAEPIIKAMEGLLERFRKKSRDVDLKEEERIAEEERKRQEEQDALDAAAAAEEEANNPEPTEDEPLDDTVTDDEVVEDDPEATEDDVTEAEATEGEEETSEEETETPPSDDADSLDDALGGLDNLGF